IATDHIPFIQELQHRQVLKPPPLLPLYLQDPAAVGRLAQLRQRHTVRDLVAGRLK
ncbi:MAG: DUF1704 domain-containing protein, partial [Planctomycetales bacterium]|nr:DUF1704 domain-containing protein [Planctomycetales bacterium]